MGVPIALGFKEDAASGAQVIDGGLRFDSSKKTYLTRTPGSAGNRTTWTWSGWVKRTRLGNGSSQSATIFVASDYTANTTQFYFESDNTLYFYDYQSAAYIANLRTTQVFRDVSAWAHFMVVFDSNNGTSGDRVRIYVNGSRITDFSTATYPNSGATTRWNNAVANEIASSSNTYATDIMLSNCYLIDGQALDPSYFGYTDPLTNTWRPKKFKPQATPNNGTTWSSSGNFSGDVRSQGDSYGPPKMFNGIIGNESTTGAVCFAPYSSNSTCTWTSPTTFTGLTSLRLYVDVSGSTGKLSVNGTDYSSLATALSGGDGWITIPQSSLSTISFGYTNGINDATGIAAVEVNGVILLDGDTTNMGANAFYLPMDGNTPIGQDQSGRGNNWTPVNFGGSNTIEKATGALPILNTDGGGKVARVGVRTDSNASSLVLALPLVGIKSDFSNAINSGTSNKVITANGNAAASSSQSNFYGGSFYFDGTGDFLSVPYSSDIDIGAGDFTVETWIYKNAASEMQIFDFRGNPCNTGWALYTKADGRLEVYDSVAATQLGNSNPYNVTVGAWNHVALTKSGSTVTFWVNGINGGTFTRSSLAATTSLRIGISCDGNSSINGYLQDLRIYKGLAKYTQNFIPASTDPDILPDTPSGVAYSSNVALVPSTDGAVAFDGSGDYLNVGTSSDYAFGTGDFTMECFVYHNDLTGQQTYFSDAFGNTAGIYFCKREPVNGNVLAIYTTTFIVTGSSPLSSGRWHHIAVCRSSGTIRLFLNGVLDGSASDTTNLTQTQYSIGESFDGTSGGMNGFISNAHIVKGTALYTSNFTPPTAPITSVANTKLLCCKSNSSATVYDVSPGTITANGNAVASNFNPFTVNINTQRGQKSGYATLNPLRKSSGSTEPTISEGNLTITAYAAANNGWCNGGATIDITSGKWYWEVYPRTVGGSGLTIGIASEGYEWSRDTTSTGLPWLGSQTGTSWSVYSTGSKYFNASGTSYMSAFTSSDTVGVAFDMDAQTLTYYLNGVSQGVAFSGVNAGGKSIQVGISVHTNGSNKVSVNFGQKPFKFPPPAGFQPLALANTPRPTIVRPDQYVGVATFTGTGGTQSIITGFKPDLVWVKGRTAADNHSIFDSVRGVGNYLASNSTGAEGNNASSLTSFNRDGFTSGGSVIGGNGTNYVAWAWKAGGNSNTYNINDIGYSTASAAGLTAGTITPTGASVNTKSGFSIIKATMGSGTSSFSHGLGQKPALIIVKNTASTSNWVITHQSLGTNMNDYYLLFTTAGSTNSVGIWGGEPTSTTFSLGTGLQTANQAFIAYLWAEIPGFSKFGTYTGNASTDGPMIVTGFKPKLIILKRTDTTLDWVIRDTERDKYNGTGYELYPNTTSTEGGPYTSPPVVDWLSNGFKLRSNTATASNGAGPIIYAAFAEAPSFNLYGGQANAR